MTILKKKRMDAGSVKKKVVGAYLPLPLIEFLTMYSLCTDTSNAKVIEQLLFNWKKYHENIGLELSGLIDGLIPKVDEAWKALKVANKNARLSSFKRELRKELNNRGISMDTIDKVLNHFKNEKNS